jgi:hypothetical protein
VSAFDKVVHEIIVDRAEQIVKNDLQADHGDDYMHVDSVAIDAIMRLQDLWGVSAGEVLYYIERGCRPV